MAELNYKPDMVGKELAVFEQALTKEFKERKSETDRDLSYRLGGVKAQAGSTGYQFVGYKKLEQFYRGDQWDHDEAPGASQRTENMCAMIVDNFASLLFDVPVEIHCPPANEDDNALQLKAELKEKLIQKVYDDNDADDIVFPNCAKVGSQYGDSFIVGPFLDKNDSANKKDWKIVFYNAENPASILPIFSDANYNELEGFIDTTRISANKMMRMYSDQLDSRGLDKEEIIKSSASISETRLTTGGQQTLIPMVNRQVYWTKQVCAIFINGQLINWYWHDWGFVPLEKIKNTYVPNYPWGKSDIEDVIDPQLFYTRTNNDLANALKFLSTINMKGKNLDGMEVLVHGISKIFNLPDEGELDPIQRSGDPYASKNFVDDRRRAILDISGVSEALMASVGNQQVSGRGLALAMQSVIRRLNPRIRAYRKSLRSLNRNILKLTELYWPETKIIIMGDYNNQVEIISALLRNIVDELNKMQSGTQSLTTTMKNLGIAQPMIEQKRMKKDLSDPILGPQIARQPAVLPQMQSPMATPGTPSSNGSGMPAQPNQSQASPSGAVTAANQQTAGVNFIPAPQVNP